MAKRFPQMRRAIRFVAGAVLLGTVGCAFPHGSTQGDPILGNFNRPIVPTPAPERGGIGFDSPAYDGGARIGLGSPDVPTAIDNTNGFMTLPNLTTPNLFSGAKMPFTTPNDTMVRQTPTQAGARLPGLASNNVKSPTLPQPWTGQASPGNVTARSNNPATHITSGSSFDPYSAPPEIKTVKYESGREPVKMFTFEEGQTMLEKMGAKNQRLEQIESGEWAFSCTMGYKIYEHRGRDKMDVIRSVAEQIQKDQ